MSNVKTIKDRKYITLAYRVSVVKQKYDAAKKEFEDLQKELKALNADKLPADYLTSPFTIINGFTSEIACSQTVQNRSQVYLEAVCQDLKVPALTVENGYRIIQPVHCLSIGKMSKRGF